MDEFVTRLEFEQYVMRMEAEHKTLHKRYDEISKQLGEVHTISINVEKLSLNMEHMLEEMKKQRETENKQDERLEVLESRDGEMWRSVIKYVVTASVGALLGYIFFNLGL